MLGPLWSLQIVLSGATKAACIDALIVGRADACRILRFRAGDRWYLVLDTRLLDCLFWMDGVYLNWSSQFDLCYCLYSHSLIFVIVFTRRVPLKIETLATYAAASIIG